MTLSDQRGQGSGGGGEHSPRATGEGSLDQVLDPLQAGPAVAGGVGGLAGTTRAAGTCVNGPEDVVLGDGVADADEHVGPPGAGRNLRSLR